MPAPYRRFEFSDILSEQPGIREVERHLIRVPSVQMPRLREIDVPTDSGGVLHSRDLSHGGRDLCQRLTLVRQPLHLGFSLITQLLAAHGIAELHSTLWVNAITRVGRLATHGAGLSATLIDEGSRLPVVHESPIEEGFVRKSKSGTLRSARQTEASEEQPQLTKEE